MKVTECTARTLRQGDAISELEAQGEDLEVAMAKAERALEGIGVSIRGETADSLRDIEDIIGDVANAWDTLSDSERQAVSEAMAGTQRSSMFSALIENYDKVLELQDEGLDSFGELAEANQKRVESFEGQLNILKDKMLAFTDGLQPLIFGSVELGNNLLDLVNGFGAIPTVVGLASASFLSFSDSGQKVKNTLMEMLGSKIQLVDGINQIISAQNKMVESSKNEVAITQQQISSTIKKIAKLRLEHSAQNDKTKDIYKEQQALVGLNKELVNSQKQLAIATLKATAFQAALSLGLTAVISGLVWGLGKLWTSLKDGGINLDSVNAKFKELNSSQIELSKTVANLDGMVAKYEELEQQMKNSQKGSEEYKQAEENLLTIQKQLAENYPSLVSYIDEEGNAYATNLDSIKNYTEAQRELLQTQKEALESTAKTNKPKLEVELGELETDRDKIKEKIDYYTQQIEDLETKMANSGNAIFKTLAKGDIAMFTSEKNRLIEKLTETNEKISETSETLVGYEQILQDTSEKTEKATESTNKLANSMEELEGTTPMKDLNESYLEAVENIAEAQDLLDSFKDGLDASELRNIFDSDLMADYNGALSDSVSIQEHLNNKIAEMQEVASNTYFDMNRESSDFWNNQIKNSQEWLDYEKQVQNDLTQHLAEAFGIQLGDFQAYIDSKGGLREVDLTNAENLADAEKILNSDLNSQILNFFSQFINGKADARVDDMDNVVAFLKAQNTEEVKTIQQLAKLWNDYYNAKKAEINATISTLKKVDVTASKVSNQIKEDGNKALANAGLQMPGIKDHYNSMYGQANQLKEDVQNATEELKQLETENNKFQEVLNNLNGYNASNSLKQNYTDANKGKITGSSGSGSSGNKGSSSSSSSNKEVEDLDLQIDRYYDLQDVIDDVNNALDKNQTLQERATGVEKAKLMKEEIQLYKDLQKATQDLVKEQQKERDELKKTISSYGGTFDSNGDIKNRKKWLEGLQAQVNKLSGEAKEAKKEEIEALMSVIEKYEELHNDTIPATQLEYEELANTIKDLEKEQLEYVTDLQKDITSAIENELKKRTDAIKTELEKQRDLYDSQYDEENWERELATEQRKLDEIQQQIDNAMRDTSLAGQLYLQQLREEYAAQEEALNEMIRDKEHELGQNRFDEEIDRIEKEEEAMLDPENIADLVNQAISKGFVTIGNETIELNKLMTDWLDETGDGLYAVGNLLKSEMIDNLQTVKSLMQSLGLVSLSGNVSVSSASYVPTANTRAIDNAISNNTNNSNNVSIGSLLTVEGNVTEDVMPQLQNMISQSEKQITNSIMKALTFS